MMRHSDSIPRQMFRHQLQADGRPAAEKPQESTWRDSARLAEMVKSPRGTWSAGRRSSRRSEGRRGRRRAGDDVADLEGFLEVLDDQGAHLDALP